MKKILIIIILFISFRAFTQSYDTAIAILQPRNMAVHNGTGSNLNNYYIQDSSGYVQDSVTFPATRNYRFDFTGRTNAKLSGGAWPTIRLMIDGVLKATISVSSTTDSIWSALFSVNSGKHAVRIAYTDLSANGSNRMHMGLLYIFSSNTTSIVKYPTPVVAHLPATYGTIFLNGNHFTSGHLRGVNTGKAIKPNVTFDINDFSTLQAYKANLFRCWATMSKSGTTYTLTTHTFDTLDAFITRAAAKNVYVVLVITDASTGLEQWHGSAASKNSYRDRVVDVVNRYKNNKTVAGFALANEPSADNGLLGEFCQFAQTLTSAIRNVDTNHVIIVPSMVDNGSSDLNNISEPLPYRNVVYELHFYQPFEITHQGINVADNIRTEYPNGTFSATYNAGYLGPYNLTDMKAEIKLTSIRKFSTRYNIPIYTGEFGCVVYAPKYSSSRYMADVISILETYKWAWTSEAFRTYEPWDQEIQPAKWNGFTYTNAFPNITNFDSMHQFRTDTTLTMITLKNYWALNVDTIPFTTTRYYADADGDTYGDANVFTDAISQPTGYVLNNDDCDDTNAGINPGEFEICGNSVDENCDGIIY